MVNPFEETKMAGMNMAGMNMNVPERTVGPTMRDVAGAGPTNVGRPRSYPHASIGDNPVWRDAYHREGGVKDHIRSQMPWDQPEYRRADRNFGFRQYHPGYMEEELRAGLHGPGMPQSYPGMQNPGVKSRMEMFMDEQQGMDSGEFLSSRFGGGLGGNEGGFENAGLYQQWKNIKNRLGEIRANQWLEEQQTAEGYGPFISPSTLEADRLESEGWYRDEDGQWDLDPNYPYDDIDIINPWASAARGGLMSLRR